MMDGSDGISLVPQIWSLGTSCSTRPSFGRDTDRPTVLIEDLMKSVVQVH